MKKITIFIIILILVIIGGIGAYFIFQKPAIIQPSTTLKQLLQRSVASSLFGTMNACGINEVAINMPSILDTVGQKGWTEFRKDNSAYQNLLINLKKIIQDHSKLIKATSFSLDREIVPYFTWNVIEPQKGQFDWELTDLYVQAVSSANVKISAVIQPFASWDQKNTRLEKEALDFAYFDYKAGPPKDIDEYKNFLTKTVERYKDKVAVWEIGNEPENSGGGYQNNPEGYFDLVKITSETIKKVDPQAKITNGGAMEIVGRRESNSFKTYWTKFFALGGGQYLDYFNVHYNIERSLDAKLDPDIFEKNLIAFNNLMDENGGRKPLYITEFGIYSGSPSFQTTGGQFIQGQPPGSVNGKCGDNICDDFEKQNPNICPQDCGGSMPNGYQKQSSVQPIQKQVIDQNFESQDILNQNQQLIEEQPQSGNQQGNTMSIQTQKSQATLYFKYSILAFVNGTNLIFIDLIGPDNNMVGSSMAFNIDNQPRLFLTTLKMIDSKISGFSKVEKIDSGQYRFTAGNKTIYALWSGALPNEILDQVKVTDIIGQERLTDAAEIKLSVDQPIFIEVQ